MDNDSRLEWSDADFEEVGWHDMHIHAFAAVPATFELLFDVDVILQWECGVSDSATAHFKLAPATLTFLDAGFLKASFESQQGLLTIDRVERTGPKFLPGSTIGTWNWVITCHEGTLSFEASGFRLALRGPATTSRLQYLSSAQRGPPSFAAHGPRSSKG